MSEKPESDDFDDDAEVAGVDSDDGDIDSLLDDLGKPKRGAAAPGEPAWRKLEKYREQKQTAELTSDFEDYDIGDEEDRPRRKPRKPLFD